MKKFSFVFNPYHLSTLYLMIYLIITFLTYAFVLPGQMHLWLGAAVIFTAIAWIWIKNQEMPKEFLWIYKISSFVGTLFFTYTSVFLIIEKIR